jgi:hypothetical protein
VVEAVEAVGTASPDAAFAALGHTSNASALEPA